MKEQDIKTRFVSHEPLEEKMTNMELYKNAFIDALGANEEELAGLKYQSIDAWDSVGHMELIAAIEDAFDITMDTDDIIDLSSFEVGIEMMKKYGIEL